MKRLLKHAMIATIVAAPISAQTYSAPTGSILARPDAARLNTGVVDTVTEKARMLASLGACLADRYPIVVQEYLNAVPNSPVAQKKMRYFETTECIVDARMEISGDTFREALFTGMYLRDFGRIAPPLPTADVRVDYAVGKTSASEAHVLLMQFGDCVDRIDPVATRAFLLSPAGTAEESVRIADLGPVMSQCLAPGAKLGFGRAALRGYLGEAAYRLGKAALLQVAVKGN